MEEEEDVEDKEVNEFGTLVDGRDRGARCSAASASRTRSDSARPSRRSRSRAGTRRAEPQADDSPDLHTTSHTHPVCIVVMRTWVHGYMGIGINRIQYTIHYTQGWPSIGGKRSLLTRIYPISLLNIE